MDNYGQTMKGPFINEIIANVSSLVYGAEHAGRILCDANTGQLYFGDSVNNAFRTLSDIPRNSIILFESDTQQVGYTLLTDQTDDVVYITNGSGAGGEAGGTAKSGSTWTQPGHTHTAPSHSHTAPSHTHDLSNHTHTVAAHSHYMAHTHTYSGSTSYEIGSGENRATGGDNSHYHTYSGTTAADSLGGYTGNSSPATGGPSYNQSGAGGSGPTSADGASATSSSATANTWRPKGRNYTRQRRN